MYHKYYTLLIVAGCFTGHMVAREENNPDADRGVNTIFENRGKEFLVGSISRKSVNLQYAQIRVDQGINDPSSATALSGYHALKNCLLTKALVDSKPENRQAIADDFKNALLSDDLFGREDSLWRAEIIESRRKNLAALYLRDRIILGMLNCNKAENSDDFVFNFYAHAPVSLSLEKARVTLDKTKVSEDELFAMRTICALAKMVGQELVESYWVKKSDIQKSTHEDQYEVTHNDIMNAFVKVCKTKLDQDPTGDQDRRLQEALVKSSLTTKNSFEKYFAPFETQKFSIVAHNNHNEVIVNGTSHHTKTYGPPLDVLAKNGSWLLAPEIIEIAEREKNDSSRKFNEEFNALSVHAFDFSEGVSDFEKMSTRMRCADALEKTRRATSPVTTILLIVQNNRWFSCVITKLANDFWFIVTDSHNEDRTNDPLIQTLVGMMAENGPKKPAGMKDFLDKSATAQQKDSKEEVVDYDAPLAQVALEDLPNLEEFFGERIPNDIQMILTQLKATPTSSKKPLKVANGLILSGPPGTGKSTAAQVMARIAGREVLYAGGGDFRTAYQGSSKAKLDDLFRKAKELNKPCVILIDEIDGTSSKLQPHGSTQEDNRAIKALITTLDQHRNDPFIYVICTTNYPEKMDPAILRRFAHIEVPLPNYEGRRRIISKYLKKNDLEISDDSPNAVSSTFFEMLVSATEGFSGDALEKIINTSAIQAQSGLIPEETIGARFNCNFLDFSNHSILHTLGSSVALLPLQALHWLGAYRHSAMDEHIFSQFSRHKKLKALLEEREFEEKHRQKFSDWLNFDYFAYNAVAWMAQPAIVIVATALANSAVERANTVALAALYNRAKNYLGL
ncbi:AAA family ATPase [Candidatus Dependentiae bacterium]|nr:AAA family ATPase [Candidatus Dependentiae bacterium]